MDESAIFTLNVGGCIYTTSRATLTAFPESMLGVMFGGKYLPSQRDKDGNFFIDRDGQIFRYILNFCRSGKLSLQDDFKDIKLLQEEADFYQIQPLIECIKEINHEKNTSHHWHYIEVNELISRKIRLQNWIRTYNEDDIYRKNLIVRGIEQDLHATFGHSLMRLGNIKRCDNYATLLVKDDEYIHEYIDPKSRFENNLCSKGWEIVTSDNPCYSYSNHKEGYKYVNEKKCTRWKKLLLA